MENADRFAIAHARAIADIRRQSCVSGDASPGGSCFRTWKSKPLLNEPFSLVLKQGLAQGAPFDAGSLGLLPLAPNGRSPSGVVHRRR